MRWYSSTLCAMSLFAAAGAASASSFNIAVLSAMGNNNYDNDVIAKITADAPFLNITLFKVDLVTPTAATLEGYQAVLLMANNPFADATGLGDSLKQYIDNGHGLVVANNSNTLTNCGNTTRYQLCGTFQASDYWALEPGALLASAHLTLGTIYVTNSPLLTGVTTFDGGNLSSRIGAAVNGNATRVADWSDGTPLLATRTFGSGGKEVGVNLFPPSSDAYNGLWNSSTDGARILTNSLLFAGNINATEDVPEPSYLLAGAGLAVVSLLMSRRR